MQNRVAVMPEDVQAVLPAVVAHRLERREELDMRAGSALTDEILKAVPVPL
jgi:MoxR-like ATPase